MTLIQGIGSAPGATGAVGRPAAASDTEESFAAYMRGLADSTGAADAAVTDLAVAGEMDLHDVMLAVEMESIAFDLAVQIRSRMVDAYQEIFRMQI